MTKRTGSVLSWIGILAFVVGVQFYAGRNLVSGEPPPIHGFTLDGRSFDLAQWQGAPALVYFWASWCPVCKAMQGAITSVATDHRVIAIALQSGDAAEVDRYRKASGFDLPIMLDEEGALGRRYGIRGVPAVFILDAGGRIRFASSGYTSEPGLRLRLWLAGL